MRTYEFLAIFPGTMAETELGAGAEAVKSVIAANGGDNITLFDLGKSRLAYPMKHIQYGYFRMYRFAAEPDCLPRLQVKVQLSNQLLRACITQFDPKKQPPMVAQIMSDVALAVEAEETRGSVRPDTLKSEAMEFQTISKPKVAELPAPQTTAAVNIADIDKKLDELLDDDLSKV